MLPGVRTYTAATIPSPPLVWIAGVPCLRIQPTIVPPAGSGPLDVVMFFHGNASDLGSVWKQAHGLANHLGAIIIVMEYRGYGIHPVHESSPPGIVTDARRVLRSVVGAHSHRRAHLLGYSIGAAVASELAAHEPTRIASVTLVAPFSSLRDMVDPIVGSSISAVLSPSEKTFNTRHWLAQLPPRMMVVLYHGSKDTVISVHHSMRLHAALPRSVLEVQPDGTHGTLDWIRVGELVRRQITAA
jgi:pimeloyl-ACP methyl ester carboxylesterase